MASSLVPCTWMPSTTSTKTQSRGSPCRHLQAVLVRSQMCRCGCQEWCSLCEVFFSICWTLSHSQTWISCRANTKKGELDCTRVASAGKPLSLRSALVQIWGNWTEFTHSLGFSAWNSRKTSCLFCSCPAEEMNGFGDIAAGSCPFFLNLTRTIKRLTANAKDASSSTYRCTKKSRHPFVVDVHGR